MNFDHTKIKKATPDDEKSIRALWSDCFGDDDLYLNMYFKYHQNFDNVRLLFLDRLLIGMIHLIPCSITNGKKAYYWYAVGIDSKFRRQGYFRYFCSKILEENQRDGYSNICLPANGLESIYKKIGFDHAFWAKDTAFFHRSNTDIFIEISEANAEDFLTMAQEQGSVVWNLDDIEYALLENKFCDGFNLKFFYNDVQYVFMAIKKNGYYLLDHTNLSVEIVKAINNCIRKKIKDSDFVLRTPTHHQDENRFIVGLSDDPAISDFSRMTFTLA